ncbi:hypothetical protein GCM10027060_26450 [Nesterenkonia halophila]
MTMLRWEPYDDDPPEGADDALELLPKMPISQQKHAHSLWASVPRAGDVFLSHSSGMPWVRNPYWCWENGIADLDPLPESVVVLCGANLSHRTLAPQVSWRMMLAVPETLKPDSRGLWPEMIAMARTIPAGWNGSIFAVFTGPDDGEDTHLGDVIDDHLHEYRGTYISQRWGLVHAGPRAADHGPLIVDMERDGFQGIRDTPTLAELREVTVPLRPVVHVEIESDE